MMNLLFLVLGVSLTLGGAALLHAGWWTNPYWEEICKQYLTEKVIDTIIGGGVGTAMILKGLDIILPMIFNLS